MSAEESTDKLNLVAEGFDGVHLTVRFSRLLNSGSVAERKVSYELRMQHQCTYNGTKDNFTFPLTSNSACYIRDKWPDIKWEVPQAKDMYQLLLSLEASVERRADVIGKYVEAVRKVGGRGNPVPADAVPSILGHTFKRKPMAHQLVALDCCRTAPFLGLFMEMGTGKTKVISDLVDYAAQRHEGEHPLRVLIMCPKSVLVNWVRELKMDVSCSYKVGIMSHMSAALKEELEDFNLVAAKGGDFGSTETLLELVRNNDVKLQVCITNYDNAKGRLDLMKAVKFDVCVLDESHKIKSIKAKRTKAILELAMTCGRKYLLTGTPLTQNPLDLFSQFEFMGPGMGLLGYTTHYAYEQAYSQSKGWGQREWGNSGKLLTLASKWTFSVKKKDCLDLPDKIYTQRRVEMSKDQREMYDRVATEVLLVLESLGAEVTVQNILVQYLRLAQVTSGYVKTSDGREITLPKGDVKIKELLDVLDETNGQKVVVWSRFIHEIEAISDALKKAKIKHVNYYGGVNAEDRQRAIDSFQNDPQTKVFIGNAQAGGLGINLTEGTVVVYVSNDFSLANRLQSEDRTHRVGQKHSVTYIDLVCEDSIDELVLQRLQDKREMAEFFTNPQEMVSSLKDFLMKTVRR